MAVQSVNLRGWSAWYKQVERSKKCQPRANTFFSTSCGQVLLRLHLTFIVVTGKGYADGGIMASIVGL